MKLILSLLMFVSLSASAVTSLFLGAQLKKKFINAEEFAEVIDNNRLGYFCQSESHFVPGPFSLYSTPMVVDTRHDRTELPWNSRKSAMSYNDLRFAKNPQVSDSPKLVRIIDKEGTLETVWEFVLSDKGILQKMTATTKDDGVLVAKDVCKS
jgi:hypothetical protein